MALNRILHASMRVVARTRDDEAGQALVEYSLLILLLAVAAIAAVRTFGLGVSTLYQSIINVYP
jgi:Flp pilus assembly pilin Flp